MTFTRIHNPTAAMAFTAWYVPVDQTRDEIVQELWHRLTYNPDETFMLAAYEGDFVHGIVVAYRRMEDVFIWQARSEDMTREFVDLGLNGVIEWARSLGVKKIAATPNRADKIWFRRWGFKAGQDSSEVVKEI